MIIRSKSQTFFILDLVYISAQLYLNFKFNAFKNIYLKLDFSLSSSYPQVISFELVVSVACFKDFQRRKMAYFLFEYCP